MAEEIKVDDTHMMGGGASAAAEAATAEVLERVAPSRQGKPKPDRYLAPTDRWDFETAVQADRELNFAAVKAAHVLLDLYNHHDGCAWPSTETIAERIGVTRTTASAAVNKLAARGWFQVEPVRRGNRQGANRYVPCLDRIGLSVGPGRHSEVVSVGQGKPQRRPQRRLSVGSDRVSASATADTNPAREPDKGNPSKDSSSLAHARELLGSSERKDDRRRSQAGKMPLPADWQFPGEAVASATAAPRNLSEADIARALAGFRALATGEDTVEGWARREAAYLARVQAKPDPDEMVWVGDSLTGSRRRRSEVKPWESYRDSRGVVHSARHAKPTHRLRMSHAV